MKQDKNIVQMEGDLRAAEGARDIFLANMSHELRTPLNTMLGLNELILRECQDEAILEYARDMKQTGDMLLSLVSDILDFSKLEAGRLELSEGIYDMSSLLNDLVNSISPELRKKKLELVLAIDEKVPSKMLGDEVRIRQIVSNLLNNAVKFTQKGKVVLHMSVEPKEGLQTGLHIAVEDTGIGIKKEDMQKIFEAFSRMNTMVRDAGKSTGLGLAITNRLVKMMGGELTVASTYGKGTLFSFTIEQTVIDEEPIGDFRKRYQESLTNNQRYHEKFIAPLGRILVVDDNAMNLAVAQGLLKQTRLQVDVASSGAECLELLKRKDYHLICLDHMMPEMDGVETLHAIRKLTGNPSRNVPVIALTANAVSGARDFYLKAGFQDYLTKPIDAAKFEEMLIWYLPKNLVYLAQQDENRKDSEERLLTEEQFGELDKLGFNIKNGLKYMGGNRELYEKVLKDFHSILGEKSEALRSFVKQGDMHAYAIIVHSLKGNARNVGADELADEAYELEKMSKAGLLEDVTVRTSILFSMITDIRERLARYFETEKTKETELQEEQQAVEEIDDDEWEEALHSLAEKLDDFDGKGATELLERLRKCKRPESDRTMLRLCDKAVRDYAFDVALDIVNAVL